MANSIIHIGAGKCGSSALQRVLSLAPSFSSSNSSTNYEYISLSNNGDFLRQDNIVKAAKTSAIGYSFSSIPPELLVSSAVEYRKHFGNLADKNITPILSSEAWLHQHEFFKNSRILPKLNLNSKVIVFVRPQVPWINSAWWQWGAWQDIEFTHWLDRGIKNDILWANVIQKWMNVPGIESIEVYSATRDVISTFFQAINAPVPAVEKTNSSLDSDLLRFLQRNRQFRPHLHASEIDFIIERWLPPSKKRTPWIIPHTKTSELLKYYYQNNVELLSLVSSSEKKEIENNPKWWDIEAFENNEIASLAPPHMTVEELESISVRAFQAIMKMDRHIRSINLGQIDNCAKGKRYNLKKAISINGIRRLVGI